MTSHACVHQLLLDVHGKMNKLEDLQKYASDLAVLRRIIFATTYLPQDIPNYWQEVVDFAKPGLPVPDVQAVVENLQYLNHAAFRSDKQLFSELLTNEGTNPTGIFLVSTKKKVWSLWCKSQY